MNKVLLVWEEVPEDTEVYVLELSDSDLKKIKKCHGAFINLENTSDVEKALDWLNKKLASAKWQKCRVYGSAKDYEKQKHDEQRANIEVDGKYTLIISGFIL